LVGSIQNKNEEFAMKKQILLFVLLLSISSASYANWFRDIWEAIIKYGSTTNILLGKELTLQEEMLRNEKDMQRLVNEMHSSVTGHSGYGTYQLHDFSSYGAGANDWVSVIKMANQGRGDGALGEMIASITRDYPADIEVFNHGISNTQSQRYYAMKSQTTLAARAASELDYNKIQQQIAYQQMLMQQIEKTKDIKAAMDLANRIQVEGNLINLEILRQSALVNQQKAVAEQASVMSALSNAKFLTKQ
jgi:hypothetical protein